MDKRIVEIFLSLPMVLLTAPLIIIAHVNLREKATGLDPLESSNIRE